MSQYALLIYVPADGLPEEQREFSLWHDYTESLRGAGVLVADNALDTSGDAQTLRVRNGKAVVRHGHFAETAEVLGGYYVIDVPDVETAFKWAARIPSAPSGSVEIRSVMVLPDAECVPAEAAA